MGKNFDVQTDAMVNAALAALATADKLWLILIDEDEASVAVTDTFADPTRSGATSLLSASGCSCSGRVIALPGGPFEFTGTVETPRAVLALTDDPGNAGSTPFVVQNLLSGGAAYDFATEGTLAVDSLSVKFGYLGEP